MTMMMTMLLFWNVELSVFVSPIGRERTVVVEEVLYTFRLVFIVRFSYGFLVPRRFGGFAQVLQTVQVAVLGRPLTRPFVISIILTLNKIFEYVEMTIFSRPIGSPRIPRRFRFFA
jgi:hypothetical protein